MWHTWPSGHILSIVSARVNYVENSYPSIILPYLLVYTHAHTPRKAITENILMPSHKTNITIVNIT